MPSQHQLACTHSARSGPTTDRLDRASPPRHGPRTPRPGLLGLFPTTSQLVVCSFTQFQTTTPSKGAVGRQAYYISAERLKNTVCMCSHFICIECDPAHRHRPAGPSSRSHPHSGAIRLHAAPRKATSVRPRRGARGTSQVPCVQACIRAAAQLVCLTAAAVGLQE